MALTALDALLLLMVLIWGTNFSLVKVALRDFPEIAFNAMRMLTSAIVFVAVIASARERPSFARADWLRLVFLGIVGTFLYQFMFVGGLKRTSAGNASLIVGASPIVIALLSSLAGHERVAPRKWFGVALGFAGLYFVVGHRADWSAASLAGDGLMIASMVCWATYSVAAQPMLKKYSPLAVTGTSFSIGAALYLLFAAPRLVRIDWPSISGHELGADVPVGPARAQRVVCDLVHRPEEARRHADLDVQLPHADRRDDRGGVLARRAGIR